MPNEIVESMDFNLCFYHKKNGEGEETAGEDEKTNYRGKSVPVDVARPRTITTLSVYQR